jgi:hypothetical protein
MPLQKDVIANKAMALIIKIGVLKVQKNNL